MIKNCNSRENNIEDYFNTENELFSVKGCTLFSDKLFSDILFFKRN